MRQASWRRREGCCALNRCKPCGIERRVATRKIKSLVGQIAHFINEKHNPPEMKQMLSAGSWGNMDLPHDQSEEQGFIACLFGSPTNGRGFGHRAKRITWRGRKSGKLLHPCALVA